MSHATAHCVYHIVIGTKYRKKTLYGDKQLCVETAMKIVCEENQLMVYESKVKPDHVHLLVKIPPYLAVSQMIAMLKVKSASVVMRHHPEVIRDQKCFHLWARGYYVRTVGYDFEKIQKYIKNHGSMERTLFDNHD
ncbi:hypothetical protein BVY01_05235 [bacterium I07]|nr:hypothetical protein BVY01_05235 [bacterium I07]